eukprot:9489831-Pyramimonas_sp.AAC.2
MGMPMGEATVHASQGRLACASLQVKKQAETFAEICACRVLPVCITPYTSLALSVSFQPGVTPFSAGICYPKPLRNFFSLAGARSERMTHLEQLSTISTRV